jgi:hypothetical protein
MMQSTSYRTRTARSEEPDTGALRFSMQNWVLLALGMAAIVAGFVTLSGGSTVLAPLLLVLGYVVLLPLGIIR